MSECTQECNNMTCSPAPIFGVSSENNFKKIAVRFANFCSELFTIKFRKHKFSCAVLLIKTNLQIGLESQNSKTREGVYGKFF